MQFGTTMRNSTRIPLDVPVDSRVSQELVDEVIKALKSVGAYGSIEIYIQDRSVTQITVRHIKKTKHILPE